MNAFASKKFHETINQEIDKKNKILAIFIWRNFLISIKKIYEFYWDYQKFYLKVHLVILYFK